MFLIVVVVVALLIELIFTTMNKSKENFTSGFRQLYRPHIRNIRLTGQGYYNKIKNNTNLFFRKFGLI
jgi:hypothetical protein